MTDGKFPTSSTPSFGKMEKQFEEFRHRLEELGSLLKRIWAVVTEIDSVTRPHICQPSSRSAVFLYCCYAPVDRHATLSIVSAILVDIMNGRTWINHCQDTGL